MTELAPPTSEDEDTCLVASDLVEMGRVDEALQLLDEQASRRHNVPCPTCGARVGKPCRDVGDQELTLELLHGYKRAIARHEAIDRAVPHPARLKVRGEAPP